MDNLVNKALAKLEEVLDVPLPNPSAENYIRILLAQKDAAVSVVNSGLKADENRFRRRENDVIEKLFQKLQAERTIEGKAERLA